MPSGTPGDQILTDAKDDDIVFIVIGPTGSGKSTLVNNILGRQQMEINVQQGGLCSSVKTKNITAGVLSVSSQLKILNSEYSQGNRLIIVDTPGLESAFPVDVLEFLLRIDKWLHKSYGTVGRVKLGGIIYVHDVSTQQYCGIAPVVADKVELIWNSVGVEKNMVFVSSNCGAQTKEYCDEQEAAMKELYPKGSRVHTLNKDKDSARNIVREIASSPTIDIRLLNTNSSKVDYLRSLRACLNAVKSFSWKRQTQHGMGSLKSSAPLDKPSKEASCTASNRLPIVSSKHPAIVPPIRSGEDSRVVIQPGNLIHGLKRAGFPIYTQAKAPQGKQDLHSIRSHSCISGLRRAGFPIIEKACAVGESQDKWLSRSHRIVGDLQRAGFPVVEKTLRARQGKIGLE